MSAHGFRNKVVIVTVLVVLSGTATAKASEKDRHFSTAEGRTVRMQPSGTAFEVPGGRWEGWYLNRTELDKAKGGKGEWYTEYARVANAALPFEACSVQTGTYLWNAPTFAGVTVRGYSLDSAAGETEDRIASKALTAARHLSRSSAVNASLTKSREKRWDRLLIAYDVWYGDYGGRANVDFYVTEVEGKSIVLVFMYADGNNNFSVVQQILESFSSH